MPALVQNGIPIFTDVDGDPLEDGYIYIGIEGLNPLSNPQQAYWDSDLTVPATNIRTKGGAASYNGTPARLYVENNYSILVQDKKGKIVYSLLDSIDYLNLPDSSAYFYVDSITELRALDTRLVNDIVSARGYYQRGDVGDIPFYYFDNTSLADDNGGSVIKPNGIDVSNPGRWLWGETTVVDIRHFGAKGDYSWITETGTDDTAAIQNAVNYASNNGRVVLIPSKAFLTSSPIRLYYDVSLNPDFNEDHEGRIRIYGEATMGHSSLFRISDTTWDKYGSCIINKSSTGSVFLGASATGSPYPSRRVMLERFSVISYSTDYAVDFVSCPEAKTEDIGIACVNANGRGMRVQNSWFNNHRRLNILMDESITADVSSRGLAVAVEIPGGESNFDDGLVQGFRINVDILAGTLFSNVNFKNFAFQDGFYGVTNRFGADVQANFYNCYWEDCNIPGWFTNTKTIVNIQDCFISGGDATTSDVDTSVFIFEAVRTYKISGCLYMNPHTPFVENRSYTGEILSGEITNLYVRTSSLSITPPVSTLYMVITDDNDFLPEIRNCFIEGASALNYDVVDLSIGSSSMSNSLGSIMRIPCLGEMSEETGTSDVTFSDKKAKSYFINKSQSVSFRLNNPASMASGRIVIVKVSDDMGEDWVNVRLSDNSLLQRVNSGETIWLTNDGDTWRYHRFATFGLGTTAKRPSEALTPGLQFFDTTLGKPIWWDGTNWVDATGTTV